MKFDIIVHIQDFTPNSEIDLSKSVFKISRQIYAIFRLSKEEIEFIKTNIVPMDDAKAECVFKKQDIIDCYCKLSFLSK